MNKVGIKQLSADDRPREKLLHLGSGALSKAELLAIIVGTGSEDENAVSLMQRILCDSGGSLTALGAKSVADLQKYKGIGPAKAVMISAACQLGKLMQAERVDKREQMNDPGKVRDHFMPKLVGIDTEEVWIMLLDVRLCLIADRQVSKGGFSQASVDVRLVMREAVMGGAASIILVHNHPSGNVSPSRADDELTKKVYEAGKIIGIKLQDHVIIGGGGQVYSYHSNGKL